MFGDIRAEIGLDLNALLHGDEKDIKKAISAALFLEYSLIDNDDKGETMRFEQQIISIYLYNGEAYVSIEVFDAKLNVKLDLDIGTFLMEMLGILPTEGEIASNLSEINTAISMIMNGWSKE